MPLPQVIGTTGPDNLIGSDAAEEFLPGLGDDVVHAGGGDDFVYARDSSIADGVNEGNDPRFLS